jgi:hypothetical protein
MICISTKQSKEKMTIEPTKFAPIVLKLRERYTLMEIQDVTGLDYSAISRIGSGHTTKVNYDVGVNLMAEYQRIVKRESRRK